MAYVSLIASALQRGRWMNGAHLAEMPGSTERVSQDPLPCRVSYVICHPPSLAKNEWY